MYVGICIPVCMWVCTYVCICAYMYVIHVFRCACLCLCLCMCVCTSVALCICVWERLCMWVCEIMYGCLLCVDVRLHVFLCMYTRVECSCVYCHEFQLLLFVPSLYNSSWCLPNAYHVFVFTRTLDARFFYSCAVNVKINLTYHAFLISECGIFEG